MADFAGTEDDVISIDSEEGRKGDLVESGESGAQSDSDESLSTQDDSQHCFVGHTGPVFAVAWSRQGELVASGGGDNRAYLWQTGEAISASAEDNTRELLGHADTVACLAFNCTGDLLASGGLDGQVRVWAAADGRCTARLEGPQGGIEWVDWHPKGNVVLAGCEDFSVWMWLSSGAVMQTFLGHSGTVTCGRFTPDGKHIVTGGGDGDESLKLWDPKTATCTLSIRDPHNYHSAGLTVLSVHEDGATVLTGSEDCTARLVNLQSGRVLGVLAGHSDSVEAVAFVPQLRLAATCSVDGDVRVWDLATMTARSVCRHDEAVVRLKCHPTRPLAFTGCLDGRVRCWDLRSGQCLATKNGHRQGIQDLAVSPGGDYVLTGSDDCTARIFEFADI